jgi:hypothetical protein
MEQAEARPGLSATALDAAFAGDAETTSAMLLKFPLQPARSSELTISCRRPWAVVVGLWADRPSPPPSAASPPPTEAGRHASARSECCARRQNMLVHDADIPRPYSSQRRPRLALQTQTPVGVSNAVRSRKMAPRRYARRGQAQRVRATGFDPPRTFPTGICEIGSCQPTEFRALCRARLRAHTADLAARAYRMTVRVCCTAPLTLSSEWPGFSRLRVQTHVNHCAN